MCRAPLLAIILSYEMEGCQGDSPSGALGATSLSLEWRGARVGGVLALMSRGGFGPKGLPGLSSWLGPLDSRGGIGRGLYLTHV